MKKYIILSLLVNLIILNSYSQRSEGLTIFDTRNVNDLPNFTKTALRVDFKDRSVIGVPGAGMYSGNITIAPWSDASGNLNHQLNFNDGGIYYRNGSHSSTAWGAWRKVVLVDAEGNMTVGKQIHPTNGGIVNRIAINPYRHTGGPWYFTSRDTQNSAYLDIMYGTKKLFSMIHSGGIEIAGSIKAREVSIEITAGADHVFNSDYQLKPLSEVELFVKENKHLPEIPSEKQMQEEGLSINEFQIKLLQKIEELTLYTIELKKEVDQLKAQKQ